MDDYDDQQIKLQAVGKLQFQRYHFLKKTLQLVVSVALLSFFLCHSSGFSLFPHSFNVYFSTFLFSFFTHTLERKYMFLTCNGILAFLAKSSVSSCSDLGSQISASSTNLTQTRFSVTDGAVLRFSDEAHDNYGVPLVAEGDYQESENTHRSEVEEQGEEALGRRVGEEALGRRVGEEEEETESEVSLIVEDEEYNEGESGSLVKQEEQEFEGEGVGAAAAAANEEVASTEELNRKVEEFIRKMKEEIRIEAQQQLIAV